MKIIYIIMVVSITSTLQTSHAKRHSKHLQKLHKKSENGIKKSSLYQVLGTRGAINEDSDKVVVNDNFSSNEKSINEDDTASAKHSIAKTITMQYAKPVAADEFKTCTDAACAETKGVDTSEWAILTNHNKTPENKDYISENYANEKTKTGNTPLHDKNKKSVKVPNQQAITPSKKKVLQDIFSSVDSTTKTSDSDIEFAVKLALKKDKTGGANNTKPRNSNNDSINDHNKIVTVRKDTEADLYNKVSSTRSDKTVKCTDAACMLSPASKSNGEKSAHSKSSKMTVTAHKADVDEGHHLEKTGNSEKEDKKEETTNEHKIIKSSKVKKGGTIMDQLVEAVEEGSGKLEAKNENDAAVTVHSIKNTITNSESDNSVLKAVQEEIEKDEHDSPEEVSSIEDKNVLGSECTDATCSINDQSMNKSETNELKKKEEKDTENENDTAEEYPQSYTQVKSECTHHTCITGYKSVDESEASELKKEEDTSKEQKSQLEIHTKSVCTDAACTAPEDVKKVEDHEKEKSLPDHSRHTTINCTDATCTDGDKSVDESEASELKKEKNGEKEETSSPKRHKESECTDAACMPEKLQKDNNHENSTKIESMDKFVQQTMAMCKDAACSAEAKPEESEIHEEEKMVKENTESDSKNENALPEKISETLDSNETSPESNSTNQQNFKEDFKPSLEKGSNETSVDNITVDDITQTKTECTDAACSVNTEHSSNETEHVEKEEKSSNPTKMSEEDGASDSKEKDKSNHVEEESTKITNKESKNEDNESEVKSGCTDASCSSNVISQEEDIIKENSDDTENDDKTHITGKKKYSGKHNESSENLLPSTVTVHSDDTDNTVLDNSTAEFLSEVLPKTNVKDVEESAQHKPGDEPYAKHESDGHHNSKTICTDTACSDRSTTDDKTNENGSMYTTSQNKAININPAKKSKLHKYILSHAKD